MRVLFDNKLNTQVGRWVEFAVPKEDRNLDVAELGGARAIKLRDIGEHSTLYGALIHLKPGRSEWKFSPDTTLPQQNMRNFVIHPAVSDDLREIIPEVTVHSGAGKRVIPLKGMKPIEKNEARVVYELLFSDGEYHTTFIYTIWALESSVRIQAETVWCDHREDTDFAIPCDAVVYTFKNAAKNKLDIWSDFALTDKISISNNTNEIRWVPPNGHLGYAEAYRFDGYLFNSLDEDNPTLNDIPNELAEESIRAQGPIVGVFQEWDNFLAYGARPETFEHCYGQAATEVFHFNGSLGIEKDLFQKRKYSCDLRPGIAGGQPAFGSTKGGPVLTGLEPYLLRAYCWGMADEALRPVHRREPDGSIVLMRNHPEHRSWMQTTHQNSKDFLGKGKMQPRTNNRGSKRYGHDENHVADYMSAYFALTGDYMAERWYISMLQGELATINSYVGWLSTDRGQGRVAQFYANACLLLPQFRQDIIDVMMKRTDIVEDQWPAKNVLAKDPTLPVMVVDIGKDVRWMADPEGNAVEAFSCWQTAKCAAGLWAFSRVCGDPELARRNRKIALLCARTVVACFFKNAQGDWAAPYAVRYYVDDREGQLPVMESNNWEVNGDGSGWTVDWSYAALKLYAIHGDDDEVLRRKAITLLKEIPPPSRWDYAEWRAV